MSTTSTALVEIEVRPCRTTSFPCSRRHIDDSQRLPDMFLLRFRDPARIVLEQDQRQDRRQGQDQRDDRRRPDPEPLIEGEITALEAEFDAGGTFTVIRGYDQAHRLFRGRRTASYVQMTADIATKVAQRAGLKVGSVTSTRTVFPHLSQAGQTDWDVLDLLTRDNGYEVAVRDGSFSFSPPATAAKAPTASSGAPPNPLVLELGKDLLRFRSVLSSAQQVGKVESAAGTWPRSSR